MKTLTIVVSDAVYQELEMNTTGHTPAEVGLVGVQMIEWAIAQDELPGAPRV